MGFALLEHSGPDRSGEPGKYDSLTGYNITISYLAYDPQYPVPVLRRRSSAGAHDVARTLCPHGAETLHPIWNWSLL